jgi:hypothetical protein
MFFCAPSRELNRQSLADETSMVPQDHCQRTARRPVAIRSQVGTADMKFCFKIFVVATGYHHQKEKKVKKVEKKLSKSC